jgi:hypothetical protein
MLEEDLALSEDSDDDLEDMAQRIEKEILWLNIFYLFVIIFILILRLTKYFGIQKIDFIII